MPSYTERFSEVNVLLDKLQIQANHNGGESTEWVSMASYHRGVVMVLTGALGGTLDVALWQAQNAAGTGAKVVTGKAITQLAATDDYSVCLIEFQGEELDADNGFEYVRAQANSSAANEFGLFVFGCVPRYAPGSTVGWDEIVT